jgi:hypothetical protein
MQSSLVRFVVAMLLACVELRAQDSRFSPNDQQIPVPECLSAAKDLWLGSSRLCTQAADVPSMDRSGAVGFRCVRDAR